MELALKVGIQVIIIFIYMTIGFILSKTKKINTDGVKQVTNILLLIVTPCVLIKSYQEKIAEFSPDLLMGLGISALLAILIHFVAIGISSLIYRKEESGIYKVNLFSAVYSNCGFMAIPLLSSTLGSDGVFYGSAYLATFTIFYWIHGVIVFTGTRKSITLKSAFLNPGVIGTAVAMLLFLPKITLPEIAMEAVSGIAGLNTPLSMMILGTYLANISIKKALSRPSLYSVSFLRLLFIPLVSAVLIFLLRFIFPIDTVIANAILIPAACPVAAISVLFSTKFDADAYYASELVAITTLISIATIPSVIAISSLFIK